VVSQWHILSGLTMALGSTQPLVKMSTRNTSWGCRRSVHEADNLTTFMCRMAWKSGSLNLLEHSGPHWACYGITLPLPLSLLTGPFHDSGGQLSISHSREVGSIPNPSIAAWDTFFSENFVFPLSVLFQHWSVLIYLGS